MKKESIVMNIAKCYENLGMFYTSNMLEHISFLGIISFIRGSISFTNKNLENTNLLCNYHFLLIQPLFFAQRLYQKK